MSEPDRFEGVFQGSHVRLRRLERQYHEIRKHGDGVCCLPFFPWGVGDDELMIGQQFVSHRLDGVAVAGGPNGDVGFRPLDPFGRGALRIGVEECHLVATVKKPDGEMRGERAFADPSFGVGESYKHRYERRTKDFDLARDYLQAVLAKLSKAACKACLAARALQALLARQAGFAGRASMAIQASKIGFTTSHSGGDWQRPSR